MCRAFGVRIQELATGKNVKRLSNLIHDIVFTDIADDGIKGQHRLDP